MTDLVGRIAALVNNPDGGAPVWTEVEFPIAMTVTGMNGGEAPAGRRTEGHGMDKREEAALFTVIRGSITMNGREVAAGETVLILSDSPKADSNSPGYVNEIGPSGMQVKILMILRPTLS